MAPPSNKLRLADLEPEQVAEEVARQVIDHVWSTVLMQLSPSAEIRGIGEPRATQIYSAVRDLAHYAIHGKQPPDDVHEHFISVLPLFSTIVGTEASMDGLSEEVDPETALGLVIRAAVARQRIADNSELSSADIAALASLSATQVRLLMRSGEIPAREGAVAAKAAQRFLAARKVPGFETRAGRGR